MLGVFARQARFISHRLLLTAYWIIIIPKRNINLQMANDKEVNKLIQALDSDHNLTYEDESSVYIEEQYPVTFHFTMKSFQKENSSLRTLLQILKWKKTDSLGVGADKIAKLEAEQKRMRKRYMLPATVNNKMSALDFRNWLYGINNLVLDAIHACWKDNTSSTDYAKYLFKPDVTENLTVVTNDQRNTRGLSRFHKLLVNNVYDLPDNVDTLIDEITAKELPVIHSQLEDSNTEVQAVARQKIKAARTAILSGLKQIQEANNITFMVMLWDLIPGAREGDSQLFARIKDHRQKHLLKQATLPVHSRKPYLATDIIDFIKANYVANNSAARHNAWDKILIAARQPKQKLYDWLVTFDNLTKAYLATGVTKSQRTLSTEKQRIVKVQIGRQISDSELIALATISTAYEGSKISTGDFDINAMKSHVAENDTRFKTFKHDKRTYENIRRDREFHNRPLPDFMFSDQSSPSKRKLGAFAKVKPPKRERSVYMSEKGKADWAMRKGKGKPSRAWYGRGHGYKAKGKPKGKGKDKGKGRGRGKGKKGDKSPKGTRSDTTSTTDSTPFVNKRCDFCHQFGHIKKFCPKAKKLHNNALYMEKKSKRSKDQHCFELLENAEGSPHCSFCLQSHCTPDTCVSPGLNIDNFTIEDFNQCAYYFSTSGMKSECAKVKSEPLSYDSDSTWKTDQWDDNPHYSVWGDGDYGDYNTWNHTWDHYYIDKYNDSSNHDGWYHFDQETQDHDAQWSNNQGEYWPDAGLGANMNYKAPESQSDTQHYVSGDKEQCDNEENIPEDE